MLMFQSWIESFTQTQSNFPQLTRYAIIWLSAFTSLVGGFILAGFLRKRFRKSSFGGPKVDATLRPIIASLIFYFIIAFSLYAFLTKIGVPSSALLAVFGSAGLAVGLALKDTLGNIAAGLMILFLSPAKVGEFIETANLSGRITEIGLFSTTLQDSNGLYIYVPNAEIWRGRLLNYGRHTKRRFIQDINVSLEADLKTAQRVVLDTLKAHKIVLEDPHPPQCFVTDFGHASIIISARCWLPAQDWLEQSSILRIALKAAFDEAGIKMPEVHNLVGAV